MKSFDSFDGIRIAYDETGEGPAVLLLHGFASDSQINWVRPGLVRAIADSGRRVVFFDARGHGESDKPHDVESYKVGAMARDAQCLLDQLGIDRVAVVGYSMGALVAIKLTITDDRVKALVLGGAGSGQASVADKSRAERIADALVAEQKSDIKDPAALAFRNFADATGADRLALAAIQRTRSGVPGVNALASISVPTLVVNGERDTLVGPLDSFSKSIPDAELEIVPGDHITAVVKPEFSAAIVRFLSAN